MNTEVIEELIEMANELRIAIRTNVLIEKSAQVGMRKIIERLLKI